MSKQTVVILTIIAVLTVGFPYAAWELNRQAMTTPVNEEVSSSQPHSVSRGGICSIPSDCGFGLVCKNTICQEDPGQHVPNG